MKHCLFFLVLLFLTLPLVAQLFPGDTLFSRVTTKQAREQRYRYLLDTAIKQNLTQPLNEDNEGIWEDALWAIELLQFKDAYTERKLAVAWSKAPQLSEHFQKNLLETTYSVYEKAFKTQVLQFMQQTRSLPIFLRCSEYLLRADSLHAPAQIKTLIQKKFATDTSIGLQILQQRLTKSHQQLPPLQDLLGSSFLPGETVLYSLQRSSRNYAGLVVIRRPDGSFIKDSTGNYFHTAQLAKAITAYPFYITNGNTPQGILRFNGFGVSKLLYIGPTPNLQLQLPYEAAPAAFFGDSTLINIAWDKNLYAMLLPGSWKNYNSIYESFYAGAMGRYDIIMHGTTIDPAFYARQTYYPQTPSLGCLCSYEDWDATGHRKSSNQQRIKDALDSIQSTSGYVVVVDIDNQQKNVTIDEVKPLLDKLSK